jgi:dolichol-phosphate mannosyltransferase
LDSCTFPSPFISMARIAVVIPAFQAAQHIRRVIAGIPAFVSRIIVVDDCSSDETAALVFRDSADDPRLVLVRHTVNQGVGGAMLTGYQKALDLGVNIIVKMDADDQMDPAYLLPLIAPILSGEADYTKGNRFLRTRELRAMPAARRIGNLGLSFMTKVGSGQWAVFDPTNGYTAIHASIVPLLNQAAIDRRYFYESSMLLELGLLRAVVRDVPIPARYQDETSYLSKQKAFLEFPRRLFRGLLYRLWLEYFVRDFTGVSAFIVSGLVLLLVGGAFGAYHWFLSSRTGIVASTGTVMLAVLPVILGVQLLLQATIADIQNAPKRPIHRDLIVIETLRGDLGRQT